MHGEFLAQIWVRGLPPEECFKSFGILGWTITGLEIKWLKIKAELIYVWPFCRMSDRKLQRQEVPGPSEYHKNSPGFIHTT